MLSSMLVHWLLWQKFVGTLCVAFEVPSGRRTLWYDLEYTILLIVDQPQPSSRCTLNSSLPECGSRMELSRHIVIQNCCLVIIKAGNSVLFVHSSSASAWSNFKSRDNPKLKSIWSQLQISCLNPKFMSTSRFDRSDNLLAHYIWPCDRQPILAAKLKFKFGTKQQCPIAIRFKFVLCKSLTTFCGGIQIHI